MLGVDVSKQTVAVCLLDAPSRQVRWERSVPNTPQAIAQLLVDIPPESAWVLEPTGRYSTPIARQVRAAGRQVLLAPPKRAKAFLASIQSRAKTDRLDSRGLAQYALAVPLRPYPLRTPDAEALAQLRAARRGVSASRSRLRQQRAALPAAATALDAAIAVLTTQIQVLDAQIAAQAPTVAGPLVAVLDAIPGVGPVTATAVATCLAEKVFTHPDQFVAYIGLDIRVRQSGARRGQQALTKQGDAELRRLLFLCAQANLCSRDPANPFKRQYERERAKGLASTAALNAVARKLARTCWSIARHGSTYQPDRVHTQPLHPSIAPPLDGHP
jgi:transposase